MPVCLSLSQQTNKLEAVSYVCQMPPHRRVWYDSNVSPFESGLVNAQQIWFEAIA